MAESAGQEPAAVLAVVLGNSAAPGDTALKEAWDILYPLWSRYLFAVGIKFGLPSEAIEDMISDVFCRILGRWEHYRDGGAKGLFALSLKMLRDKVVDAIRRRDRQRSVPLETLSIEPAACGASDDPGRGDREERKENFHAAMEELKRCKEEYYEVLYAHHGKGQCCEELARKRECSVKAMKSLLQRARQRLRRLLAEPPPGSRPWP